jgi:uncharacterized membrane protein (DUF485 family)
MTSDIEPRPNTLYNDIAASPNTFEFEYKFNSFITLSTLSVLRFLMFSLSFVV